MSGRDRRPLRVYVVDYGRKYLQMRYRCPITGRQVVRSTGETGRRAAERVAARWEVELQSSAVLPDGATSWDRVIDLYDDQHLSRITPGGRSNVLKALDYYVAACHPEIIGDVTTATIGQFESYLIRSESFRPSTIEGMVRNLLSFLKWCHRQGLTNSVPPRPTRSRKHSGQQSRGRPLTEAEFQRMLDAVPKVVDEDLASDWQWSLKCLWNSGLRIGESLQLYWDRRDRIWIDFDAARPTLMIPASADKSRRVRILPVAPEFVQQLESVPPSSRTGRILRFPSRRKPSSPVRELQGKPAIIMRISKIGRAAGILVNPETGKHASAHDLRRSFGERWAKRVLPQVLMELMRHESIETTMRYYVGVNAQRTNAIIWDAALGNNSGSTESGDT